MTELMILLRSVLGIPVPATKSVVTVVDAGVTTITETTIGYDIEYIVLSILVVLFFIGLFRVVDNFQRSFGGKL